MGALNQWTEVQVTSVITLIHLLILTKQTKLPWLWSQNNFCFFFLTYETLIWAFDKKIACLKSLHPEQNCKLRKKIARGCFCVCLSRTSKEAVMSRVCGFWMTKMKAFWSRAVIFLWSLWKQTQSYNFTQHQKFEAVDDIHKGNRALSNQCLSCNENFCTKSWKPAWSQE